MDDRKRSWNTPIREPWNGPIAQMLTAIDEHNREYFRTGDPWHLQKAAMLREYVVDLKEWLRRKENG